MSKASKGKSVPGGLLGKELMQALSRWLNKTLSIASMTNEMVWSAVWPLHLLQLLVHQITSRCESLAGIVERCDVAVPWI